MKNRFNSFIAFGWLPTQVGFATQFPEARPSRSLRPLIGSALAVWHRLRPSPFRELGKADNPPRLPKPYRLCRPGSRNLWTQMWTSASISLPQDEQTNLTARPTNDQQLTNPLSMSTQSGINNTIASLRQQALPLRRQPAQTSFRGKLARASQLTERCAWIGSISVVSVTSNSEAVTPSVTCHCSRPTFISAPK